MRTERGRAARRIGRALRRAAAAVTDAVIGAGCLWMPPLPLDPPPEADRRHPATETRQPVAGPLRAGPPAAHPERLRPDLPLTATERALARQLASGAGPSDGIP
ncbi:MULTISPECIES: DUF6059 family protein [Streptomyces]|uniref:Uncharacterized protein n=2 Tax=Streptomyces TaxID=1883 RepID=A0A3R7HL54_9ACTN|nr:MULTISPECIES: DUF6059 family protein [Streptomyces]KNE82235.1 hypothetical protein ADZ36_12055 [Streptomyces fradiae]OFA56719.1 hypothetical protein BEN35_05740 [Streptomyces fradiae]PQM22825.1 hypothetical protein Sfr7A_14080 [Streptomyces xinghaiensis]RKM97995.1 hypothetical protein SFRA_005515 [Streptomyces xinghaiensis]RNC73867.1 hypothetical protein DC095_013460 [Streptomyces xinghaiensis]